MIAFSLTGCSSEVDMSVNLNDYVIVKEPEGIHGKGTISYSLNTDVLTEDLAILSAKYNQKEGIPSFDDYMEAQKAIDCIRISCTPNQDLSNGDKVILRTTFDNQFNYDFPYEFVNIERTIEISGLKEYFNSSEQVSEEIINNIYNQALVETEEDSAKEANNISTKPEITGIYFLSAQDPNNPYYDVTRDLTIYNAIVVTTHYSISADMLSSDIDRWAIRVYPGWYLDLDEKSIHEADHDTVYNVYGNDSKTIENIVKETFLNTDITPLDY